MGTYPCKKLRCLLLPAIKRAYNNTHIVKPYVSLPPVYPRWLNIAVLLHWVHPTLDSRHRIADAFTEAVNADDSRTTRIFSLTCSLISSELWDFFPSFLISRSFVIIWRIQSAFFLIWLHGFVGAFVEKGKRIFRNCRFFCFLVSEFWIDLHF